MPADFGGVEGASVVVPAEVAEGALVAVDEFLAAELQGERKFLVVADEEEGLMEVEVAVVFGEGAAGFVGVGGDALIAALVVEGGTGAALDGDGEGFGGVGDARHEAREVVAVVVVDGGAGSGEAEVGVLAGVGEAGVVLALVTGADVDADVPGVHIRIGGAQGFVEIARKGSGGRGGGVLGVRDGGGGERGGEREERGAAE